MAYGDLKVRNLIWNTGSGDNTVVLSTLATQSYVTTNFAPKANPTFTGTINGADLILSGNLTVSGTQTIINTNVLQVEDKHIEIGKVSTPSDTTADGGGIILKASSDRTFLWVNSTDAWTSSEHIQVASGKTFIGDGSTLTALNASNLASGTVPTARLGSGTAGSSNFLRGDGSWQAIATDKIEEGNTSVETVDTGSDGHVKITTEGSERVRITNDGKIGINTTSPNTYGIHVDYTGANESVYFKADTGTGNISAIYGAAGALSCGLLGTTSNHDLRIYANNAERYRVGTSGQLGIGGATYGSSGQVLTSGGSGAAPSWTSISAAPEFTATASGAIAIEKAVMMNSNGTVVQPVNTPSAFGQKNNGTDVSFVGAGAYNPTGLAYDTKKKKILACTGSSSACRVACGSLSGTTITWGSHHTVSGANSQHIVAAYDPVNEVFCVAFVRDDYNNWGQSRALTVNSSNAVTNSGVTTIRQGTLTDLRVVYAPDASGVGRMVVSGVNGNIGNVYIGTWNSSNGNYDWSSGQNTATNHVSLRLAYDPNTKQTLVIYVDGANNDLQCKLLTTTGNASFSFGAEATIESGANPGYISTVYDTSAQKFLVLYSGNVGGGYTKVAVGTVSGTGISWATPVSVVNAYTVWSNCSYDAVNNVTHIYYRLNASPYTLAHRTVSISGTTATVGSTATAMEQTQYGGYRSQTVTTDDGANILVYLGLNASNDYQVRYVAQSAPSTTLDVDKFVGFAKAAYSNGATATVSVNSAFLTNQSNLTPGTKYFVQGDGGLGTSAVVNKSIEAGIALSATKLLIKG